MPYFLGVDLGTTYTAAAVSRDGTVQIVALGDRAAVIPSVLFIREDQSLLTGEAANRRGLGEPSRVVREFKRRIGDPTPIIVGSTPWSADALLGKLLAHIQDLATGREGEAPAGLAVTHPANWGPYKKDLLAQAVRIADVGPVITLSEPEAAAIHYADNERVSPGSLVAVYDLGGGTFDAAVLRKSESGFEILGDVEGIERLGGIDFDEAVFQHVMRSLGSAVVSVDVTEPAVIAAYARLRQECVSAKEALSADTDVTIPVFLPDLHTEIRLTRHEFEEMIRPSIQQTIDSLGRAIRGANVTADELTAVLLVGGSSRIPLIGQMISSTLGRPVAVDVHPKHVVALGAAIAAADAHSASPDVPETVDVEPTIAAADPTLVEDVLPSAPADVFAEPTPPAPTQKAPVSPALQPIPVAAEAPPPAPAEVPTPPPAPGVSSSPPDVATDLRPAPPVGGGNGDKPAGARRGIVIAAAAAVAVVVAILAASAFGGGGDDVAVDSTISTTTATSPPTTSSPTTSPATTVPATTVPVVTTASAPALEITGLSVDLSDDTFSVQFETNYTPEINNDDPEARHIHFFFDTVGVENAGQPGDGPWALYDGPSPFTGYAPADRPMGATELCATAATFDHAVVDEGVVTCASLPGLSALISDITVQDGDYVVEYSTNFEPEISSDSSSNHLHFFWNTFTAMEAGSGGGGSWILYDLPNPFRGFAAADRPDAATQLCVTAATFNHRVVDPTIWHCMDLPDL